MEFKDRLRLLIENKNVTPYRISKDTGISNQLLSNYLQKNAEPKKDKLKILAEYFNVNAGWLLTGLGDIRSTGDNETLNITIENLPEYKNVKPIVTSNMNWIQIPFIPVHARATFAETFETEIHELSTLTIPRLPGINYENGKVFEVDGDSMDPTLITGEQVFCEYVDPADWKYITGPVVVAFGNNMIVVKRIKENNLANGELTLWSDNEMGGKFTLHTEQDQIRRMYKVRYTVYKPIR
ncbi:helix-turn-helix domain-containing protein [Odoribacter splanchnicus]|uniref:helix-turn-helix domain-containing protein n=1 Tax=Odoribacter splanchnicus TaxID=28118 RepID=UPI00189B6B46|nr:helix-turn-helix domain-containing protein [Odoribacter splanchnicus]